MMLSAMQILVAVASAYCASAQDYAYTVNSIAELLTIDPTLLASDNAILVHGYYQAGDRGGGTFHWDSTSSATVDYGRYFASTFASGRWCRVLNGEAANVKMWGAKGDLMEGANGFDPTLIAAATDDTVAIQRALTACSGGANNAPFWTSELLIPASFYKLTNTLVYVADHVKIRGEGAYLTKLVMAHGFQKDILRTKNYNDVLAQGYINYGQYDGFVRIEDIAFIYANSAGVPENVSNVHIGICYPQEGNTIRNVFLQSGGYGIRCFNGGNGAPAAFRDVVTGANIAGICVEPAPGESACGGHVSIIGVTGDCFTSPNTNCLVKFVNYVGAALIEDLDAEGLYGGGVVQHKFPEPSTGLNANTPIGMLTIKNGNVNGTGADSQRTPYPFLVLKGGQRTTGVTIENLNLYGPTNLIVDEVSGRDVRPLDAPAEGLAQGTCRNLIQYEGWNDGSGVPFYGSGSRLVMGGSLICAFSPPTTNTWYRVIRNGPARELGGRLVINGHRESTEFSVQVPYNGTGANISVIRPTLDGGPYPPCVTKARAGSYYDNTINARVGFTDIYVERVVTEGDWKDQQIVLAYPMDGQSMFSRPALLVPTAAPSGGVPANGVDLQGYVEVDLTVQNSAGSGGSIVSTAQGGFGIDVSGTAADKFPYTVALGQFGFSIVTPFMRSLLDDTTSATARTTLGLAIGTDIQAYDADLADLADGSLSGSKVGSGIDAANITTGNLAVGRLNGGTGASTSTFWRGDGTWSAALQEGGEASSTPVTDTTSTTTANTTRLYEFYTLPTTEKFYVITGIEWKNGATVSGDTICGAVIIDANPPTQAAVPTVAFGQLTANSGANAIQRVSRIVSHPIRGGTTIGIFVQPSSGTHTYRTATVSSSNNRKTGITFPSGGNVANQENGAWTAGTVKAYLKVYYRGYK